jgi:hypothetical protein
MTSYFSIFLGIPLKQVPQQTLDAFHVNPTQIASSAQYNVRLFIILTAFRIL